MSTLLNATDKKTPKLEQYGLVDQGIAVDGALLMPGKELEVKEEDVARVEAEHAHLFSVGALAWTKPTAVVEAVVDAPVDTVSVKVEKKKGG